MSKNDLEGDLAPKTWPPNYRDIEDMIPLIKDRFKG